MLHRCPRQHRRFTQTKHSGIVLAVKVEHVHNYKWQCGRRRRWRLQLAKDEKIDDADDKQCWLVVDEESSEKIDFGEEVGAAEASSEAREWASGEGRRTCDDDHDEVNDELYAKEEVPAQVVEISCCFALVNAAYKQIT